MVDVARRAGSDGERRKPLGDGMLDTLAVQSASRPTSESSNAFERLIDRVLSRRGPDEPGAPEKQGPGPLGRPWALLQALLQQSTEARLYARQVLERRAADECWTPDDQEEEALKGLRQLLGLSEPRAQHSQGELQVAFSPAEVARPSDETTLRSPSSASFTFGCGRVSEAFRSSSPPPSRTRSPDSCTTGAWAICDSPETPRRHDERFKAPRVGKSALGHWLQDSGPVSASDASTVVPRPPRFRCVDESGATTPTRRQSVGSSLDVWLQPGEHVGPQAQARLGHRARSLPAPHGNALALGQKVVVVEIGSSTSSGGADDGAPLRRVSQCLGAVPEDAEKKPARLRQRQRGHIRDQRATCLPSESVAASGSSSGSQCERRQGGGGGESQQWPLAFGFRGSRKGSHNAPWLGSVPSPAGSGGSEGSRVPCAVFAEAAEPRTCFAERLENRRGGLVASLAIENRSASVLWRSFAAGAFRTQLCHFCVFLSTAAAKAARAQGHHLRWRCVANEALRACTRRDLSATLASATHGSHAPVAARQQHLQAFATRAAHFQNRNLCLMIRAASVAKARKAKLATMLQMSTLQCSWRWRFLSRGAQNAKTRRFCSTMRAAASMKDSLMDALGSKSLSWRTQPERSTPERWRACAKGLRDQLLRGLAITFCASAKKVFAARVGVVEIQQLTQECRCRWSFLTSGLQRRVLSGLRDALFARMRLDLASRSFLRAHAASSDGYLRRLAAAVRWLHRTSTYLYRVGFQSWKLFLAIRVSDREAKVFQSDTAALCQLQALSHRLFLKHRSGVLRRRVAAIRDCAIKQKLRRLTATRLLASWLCRRAQLALSAAQSVWHRQRRAVTTSAELPSFGTGGRALHDAKRAAVLCRTFTQPLHRAALRHHTWAITRLLRNVGRKRWEERLIDLDTLQLERWAAQVRKRWMMFKVVRDVWRTWAFAVAKVRAVQRLGHLWNTKSRKRHFDTWSRHSNWQARARLEVQADCIDSFAAQRHVACCRMLRRCTSEWATVVVASGRSTVFRQWRWVASQRRRSCERLAKTSAALLRRLAWSSLQRQLRQKHEEHLIRVTGKNAQRIRSCFFLSSVLQKLLRRGAWAPVYAWHVVEQKRTFAIVHRLESDHLRTQLMDSRSEAEALRAQELALQEALHAKAEAAAAEITALSVGRAVYLWQAWWRCRRGLVLKEVARCLRAAVAPMRDKRACGSFWQTRSSALVSSQVFRLVSAISAAAAQRALQRADTTRRRCRVDSMATSAWKTAQNRSLRELHHVSARLMKVRRQLEILIRTCTRAAGRKTFQCLRLHAKACERREANQLRNHVGLATVLRVHLQRGIRRRIFSAFHRLSASVFCSLATPRLNAAKGLFRPVAGLLRRHMQQGFGIWRQSTARDVKRDLVSRDVALQGLTLRQAGSQCLRRVFKLWCARTRGPRRLAFVVRAIVSNRKLQVWHIIRMHAARKGHALLLGACLAGKTRQRRSELLVWVMVAWRVHFCRAQQVQRCRLKSLLQRSQLSTKSTAFTDFVTHCRRAHVLRHLVRLLSRLLGATGLRTWCRAHVIAAAEGREAEQAAFVQGKVAVHCAESAGHLFSRRSWECGRRAGVTLLRAWRGVALAEGALRARGSNAAESLFRELRERGLRSALVSWRLGALFEKGSSALKTEESRLAALQRRQRQDSRNHACALLHSLVQQRQRLALSRAFHGHWRLARWQSLVRAVDAGAQRQQRRWRAEYSTAEQAASRSKASEAKEAERSSEIHGEVTSIMHSLRHEWESHGTSRDAVRAELQSCEESEAMAVRSLHMVEERATRDAADREAELAEIHDQSLRIEDGRQELIEALARARQEAVQQGEAAVQCEKALRDHLESFQALDCTNQGHGVEKNAEDRAVKAMREVEERAVNAEQKLEHMLQERSRAADFQAGMAQEQEHSIRRLEDILKEQGDQLRREQQNHSKGLEHLRSSASASESKALLLEEQVLALRQQLRKDHLELRARERTWACDRAAFLATETRVASLPAWTTALPKARKARRALSAQRGLCNLDGAKADFGPPHS